MAERAAQGPAPGEGEQNLAESLARRLHLPGPALRVEGVDASHLAGQEMRVGMVVFEGGQPVKGEYRTYAFPELSGAGDGLRGPGRLGRAAGWEPDRPGQNLVLVDGGLGQLAAVAKGLEEGRARLAAQPPSDQDSLAGNGGDGPGKNPRTARRLSRTRPCVPWGLRSCRWRGIAKGPSRRAGELEDRIFLPGRKNPVELRPGSPELLFLQKVRDASPPFREVPPGPGQDQGRAEERAHEPARGRPQDRETALGTLRPAWRTWPRATADELAAIPGVGKAKAEKLAAALAGLRAAG